MTDGCNHAGDDNERKYRATSEPAPGGEFSEWYDENIDHEKDEQNRKAPISRPKACGSLS
jgi:hypothetical protein